jgi:hypothetical protein
MFAIGVQELQTRGVEASCNDRCKTLQQFETKVVIFFALGAKAFSIKGDCSGKFNCPAIETPLVRRNQPRPTEDFFPLQHLNHDGFSSRGRQFYRHLALAKDKELVGFLTSSKEELPGVEPHIGRTANQEFDMVGLKAFKELVFCYNRL